MNRPGSYRLLKPLNRITVTAQPNEIVGGRGYIRCTGLGVNGYHGNGDIYDPENILEFRRHVLSQTQGKGVHFMMADGVINHSIDFNLTLVIFLPFLSYFVSSV